MSSISRFFRSALESSGLESDPLTVADPVETKLSGSVATDRMGCDYCGKVPEYQFFSEFTFVYIPDGKKWDGCQEGRDAGVPEILRKSHHAAAVRFAEMQAPYVADSPCPKCGNPIRITEYKSGRGYHEYGPEHPHIIRTCGRCNHKQYQVPLDFDPDELYPEPPATLPCG